MGVDTISKWGGGEVLTHEAQNVITHYSLSPNSQLCGWRDDKVIMTKFHEVANYDKNL